MKRNAVILQREKAALLIIDVQEKILPVMQSPENLVTNIEKLVNGFKILNIPIYFTEQYPKGLGPTSPRLTNLLAGTEAISKMSFSCFGAVELFNILRNKKITQIVVCGIESHVCVQQTVLDLLINDFQVNLAADAVSSRKIIDYETALRRMNEHGAEITTTESILFELLNVCGTDEFRAISKLVK